LPDYRKLLLTLPEIAELDRKDPAELFDYLLVNPLKTAIHGGRNRYLIVIDALDEAGESGRNALVDMLARNAARLPDWLGIVVTSRPESAVTGPFQGLNPTVLDTKTEDNKEDIRDYLRHHLATQLKNRLDADRLIEKILEKSEGVFLYIERFCEDVHQGHISLDHPEQFPQGLGGIFYQWFQRQFPDLEKFRRDMRPALRAILAAREPLPVEILQKLFNWQDEELRDFTRTLGSLFSITKEVNDDVIKPYHKSLADWLADEGKAGEFFISVFEGHRMLALFGWQEYEQGIQIINAYFLKCLPCHLHDVREYFQLYSLLHNEKFVAAAHIFEIIDPLDYLPDNVRSWAYGTRGSVRVAAIAATGVLQPPGSWFTVLERFSGGDDWCCGKCGIGNSGDINHRHVGIYCPVCGWEGNRSDLEAWLKAKAEFENKQGSQPQSKEKDQR
jgi:hypothetical protein